MNAHRIRVFILSLGMTLVAIVVVAQRLPLAIPHVHSMGASLLQEGRLTILDLESPGSPVQRVGLTHPSDYRQGTNAPVNAELIAESPHRFLIFTDTFASNPGDIQGQCGASPSGERFVHVVALGDVPHETLSVLVDSCLLDLEPAAPSPEWRATPDSERFVGQLILRFKRGAQPATIYFVADDGSVTRPEIKTSP
jgi:hypothetical protein